MSRIGIFRTINVRCHREVFIIEILILVIVRLIIIAVLEMHAFTEGLRHFLPCDLKMSKSPILDFDLQ